MIPDWGDYIIVGGVVSALAARVWWVVREFRQGITQRRKEIERDENKIEWL